MFLQYCVLFIHLLFFIAKMNDGRNRSSLDRSFFSMPSATHYIGGKVILPILSLVSINTRTFFKYFHK